MNVTTIEKCLNLIDKSNLQELKSILKAEYIKAVSQSPTKKLKLYEATKKFLKNVYDKHTQFKTIMHETKSNKQFICDGNMAIIFNQYQSELEAHEQTKAYNSIDIYRCFFDNAKATPHELTQNDILILSNLRKYNKLFKPLDKMKNIIYIFNHFYSVDLLIKFYDVVQAVTELDKIYIFDFNFQVQNEKIDALVMGCRLTDEAKEKIKNQTQDFLKILKNQ